LAGALPDAAWRLVTIDPVRRAPASPHKFGRRCSRFHLKSV
jgi:hypothetical protein